MGGRREAAAARLGLNIFFNLKDFIFFYFFDFKKV